MERKVHFLFCNNLLSPNEVDPEYLLEYDQVDDKHLFCLEDLISEGNVKKATRSIKSNESLQTMIYRGWMLTVEQYSELYHELLNKNYKLINSPEQYKFCHHFPSNYPLIQENTPKSMVVTLESLNEKYEDVIKCISMVFRNSPIMVKDYVKSQKHYWNTACFMPDASDTENVISVINEFIRLQGSDLVGGLVIREFLELEEIGNHPVSGMPMTREYRLFYKYGECIRVYNYWDEATYVFTDEIPVDHFDAIAENIHSNFFTMDIAKTKEGKWVIIELGDGQVSGIPATDNLNLIYRNLSNSIMNDTQVGFEAVEAYLSYITTGDRTPFNLWLSTLSKRQLLIATRAILENYEYKNVSGILNVLIQ